MRTFLTLIAAIAAMALLGPVAVTAESQVEVIDIMVFSETGGFRHGSIPDGIAMFESLAEADPVEDVDFTVTDVGDSSGNFTAENLAEFEVVVWLSTTLEVLDDTEQAAFEEYVQNGGGYLGIHAAADTEYHWPWYYDLVGAQFVSHPAVQEATINVENTEHVSTAHLDETWVKTDEWYSYKKNPRSYVCDSTEEAPGVETGTIGYDVAIFSYGVDIPPQVDPREHDCSVNVLMSLDESTYDAGRDAMGDHPIAWCNEWDGGRAFYTGLGHTSDSYTNPDFITHVTGGLLTAAGVEGTTCEPDAGS